MNYIKEAEEILKYYRDLDRSVKNMRREISRLMDKQTPSSLNALPLDVTGVHGGSGQDEAYNVLYRIKVLAENCNKTLAEIELVTKELDEIDRDPECEGYGIVLWDWYVAGVPRNEIAEKLGYTSMQSVYALKDRAIRKFAVRYFGIEAMKAV